MTEIQKGPIGRAVDFYLNNRIVLALSAAFCCGLIGFSLGLLFGSVFTSVHSIVLLVGFVCGLGFGAFGVDSMLKHGTQASWHAKRDASGAFASFLGMSLIFSAAASVLGVTGDWNLLVAIVTSVVVSFWLHYAPR